MCFSASCYVLFFVMCASHGCVHCACALVCVCQKVCQQSVFVITFPQWVISIESRDSLLSSLSKSVFHISSLTPPSFAWDIYVAVYKFCTDPDVIDLWQGHTHTYSLCRPGYKPKNLYCNHNSVSSLFWVGWKYICSTLRGNCVKDFWTADILGLI